MSEPVVRAEALSHAYPGGRRALDGLSFSLVPGRIFGLVGLNGAGKSTTNKILMGLLRPTEGSAWILGESADSPAARAITGYLPELLELEGTLTGRESLHFYAALSGIPRNRRGEVVEAWIGKVGMAERGDRLLKSCSKGMRQRIGIAAALLHEPRFLILDEPFGGLDPAGRHLLKTLVREARDAGAAVLLTSHQLLEAQVLCDDIGFLHRGCLLGAWPLPQLMESSTSLEAAFLERIDSAPQGG